MQVILLERIRNFGNLGDQVNVKPGYARNYLLPQGKAIIANPDNVKVFEGRRAELEAVAAKHLAESKKRADALSKLELVISARVSEEHKLYGSIGATEIIEAIKEQGLEAHKQEVQLPEGPFRAIGEYEVKLILQDEVSATLKLTIVAVK